MLFLLLMNLLRVLLVFAVLLVVYFFCCIWLLLINGLIAVGLQVKKDASCVLESLEGCADFP